MSQTAIELVAAGKEKLADLTARRTRLEVQIESAKHQLADAKREAESAHGTSDVAALREIHKKQEAENTAIATAFWATLNDAEKLLKQAETELEL